MEKKDFFISYNRADEEKAVWINWKLKSNGFTTVIQVEDFGPGNNFVLAMQKAATEATRTIAVLSPDYLQSKFTAPEWAAAFVQDPLGEQRIFIPVRVRSVELTGLLQAIVYIDLVDMDEEEAEARLLSNIQEVAGRPNPIFKKSESSALSKATLKYASNQVEQQLGLINRKPQRDHFAIQITLKEDRKTHGFLIAGDEKEYPEDIRFKLSYLLEKDLLEKDLLEKDLLQHSPQTPEIQRLDTEKSDIIGKLQGQLQGQFLCELLAKRLNCDSEKTAIELCLSQLDKNYIFYRELPSDEADNQQLLIELLIAWSNLSLASTSHSHFLLLIHTTENNKKSLFKWLPFTKQAPSWRNQVESLLKQYNVIESLLPELHSPSKIDIRDWVKLHVDESTVRDSINELLTTKFSKDSAIPLDKFKKVVSPILKKHYSQ